MNALFYTSGAVAVIAALIVITNKNAAHAVVYLVLTFLAMASVFFTLGAPLIAVLQILIYAGAIIVLFVFAIMMLNLGREAEERERVWLSGAWILPMLLVVLLLGEFIWVLGSHRQLSSVPKARVSGSQEYITAPQDNEQISPWKPAPKKTKSDVIGPKAVGKSLYTSYIIGVELASVLLLAALVAAFHLGFRSSRMGAHDE